MHRDGISDREKRFWSASDLLNDGHVCPAGVHDIFPGAAKIDRLLDRTGQLVFALRYGLAWTIDRCPLGPDRYEDLLPIRDAAAVSSAQIESAARHLAPVRRHLRDCAGKQTRFADEVCNEPRSWVLVEIGRRAELLDAAIIEYRDPVAHRQRFFLIVRHVDNRNPEIAVKLFNLKLHLLPQFLVQRAKRLVHEQ